jgi:hypothetical protein
MAHQTSKILQGQTTPRSIGRLMDADFSTGSLVFLVASMSRVSLQFAPLANPREGQLIKSQSSALLNC